MQFIIAVRFTTPGEIKEQLKDLEIPISINFERDDVNRLINVNWLKFMVRSKVEVCSTRRLRLIYSGRVLNDNTNFKTDILEPKIRQLLIERQQEERGSVQLVLPPPSGIADSLKIYIHCLVGDILTASQLAEEGKLDNGPQERTTTPEVVGFDRLLQQGFSQGDVQDLRRQFQAIYNPNDNIGGATGTGDIHDLEEEERRQQHIRQLEDRWIESTVTPAGVDGDTTMRPQVSTTDTQGLPTQGVEPTQPSLEIDDVNGNEDLLVGLLLGVFLGVLGVVFLAADDTVFNQRQRMAIIAGIFINFGISTVRGQWL